MSNLQPILVEIDLNCSSKKKIFKSLASLAAAALPVDEADTFEALLKRERLGSTGVGNGAALPQALMPSLSGPKVIFAKLSKAIDFDAIDDEPVDLVCCYLSSSDEPDQERLRHLARLNKLMSNRDFLSVIRGAESRSAIAAIFETALAE